MQKQKEKTLSEKRLMGSIFVLERQNNARKKKGRNFLNMTESVIFIMI